MSHTGQTSGCQPGRLGPHSVSCLYPESLRCHFSESPFLPGGTRVARKTETLFTTPGGRNREEQRSQERGRGKEGSLEGAGASPV